MLLGVYISINMYVVECLYKDMNVYVYVCVYIWIGVNALLVPTFCIFSISVPIFSFHHFWSLNQLTHSILVLTVTHLTEIADVANRVHCWHIKC